MWPFLTPPAWPDIFGYGIGPVFAAVSLGHQRQEGTHIWRLVEIGEAALHVGHVKRSGAAFTGAVGASGHVGVLRCILVDDRDGAWSLVIGTVMTAIALSIRPGG